VWASPWPMRLLCVANSPHTSSHLPFSVKPKSYMPSLAWVLFPWMFDTCQRSKRGLFVPQGYLRDLSIPHYSPFFRVLLYYYFLTIPLSLSLSHYCSHCFTSFVLEELGATLLLQPLPFGNKKRFGGIVESRTCSWCSYLLWGEIILWIFCELINSCLSKLVY
jgi:hypothetical protein